MLSEAASRRKSHLAPEHVGPGTESTWSFVGWRNGWSSAQMISEGEEEEPDSFKVLRLVGGKRRPSLDRVGAKAVSRQPDLTRRCKNKNPRLP